MYALRGLPRRRSPSLSARWGLTALLLSVLACALVVVWAPHAAAEPASGVAPVGIHAVTSPVGHGSLAGSANNGALAPPAAPAQQMSRTNGILGRWVVAGLLTLVLAMWVTLIAVVIRVRLGTNGGPRRPGDEPMSQR